MIKFVFGFGFGGFKLGKDFVDCVVIKLFGYGLGLVCLVFVLNFF